MLHVHSLSPEQTEVTHPENQDTNGNSAATPNLPIRKQLEAMIIIVACSLLVDTVAWIS